MQELSHTAKFLEGIMRDKKLRFRRDLVKILGIPEYSISKYMHGTRKPNIDSCLIIQSSLSSHGIHVEIKDILG